MPRACAWRRTAWPCSASPRRRPPGACIPRVTVFHAQDCGLCARALEVVEDVHGELGFELDVVDIGGDPVLEERYRELLPAVEIDGELVFTYFVEPAALRARLSRI